MGLPVSKSLATLVQLILQNSLLKGVQSFGLKIGTKIGPKLCIAPDALAVVGILLREHEQWDQFNGIRESNSLWNLKRTSWQLREVSDLDYTDINMEVVLEEFISSIR